MYNFLLVINAILPAILHHFRDIAMSKIAIYWLHLVCLTPPTEGFPWDDLREIFCECQGIARVSDAVEMLRKISTA